jgi:hypothetical protein
MSSTIDDLIDLQNGSESGTFIVPGVDDMDIKKLSVSIVSRTKNQPMDMLEDGHASAMIFTVDSEERISHLTNKFLLTDVQEARGEKAQIMETFGEAAYFFFGERTKIYNFSGTTLETGSSLQNFAGKYLWSSSLVDFYDNHLRGTKLAEAGEEALLMFKNMKLYGYITNLNVTHNSMAQHTTQFSFSMIVRKDSFIQGSAAIKELYGANQFSVNPVRMKELTEEIDTLLKGTDKSKKDVVKEAKILGKELDKRIDRRVYKKEISNNNNKHLNWMLKNTPYYTEGVGEQFFTDKDSLNTVAKQELDGIYTAAGAWEHLEEVKKLNLFVEEYNDLIINTRENSSRNSGINR